MLRRGFDDADRDAIIGNVNRRLDGYARKRVLAMEKAEGEKRREAHFKKRRDEKRVKKVKNMDIDIVSEEEEEEEMEAGEAERLSQRDELEDDDDLKPALRNDDLD